MLNEFSGKGLNRRAFMIGATSVVAASYIHVDEAHGALTNTLRYNSFTDSDKKRIVIEGLEISLDQTFVPGNMDLLVRADTISLNSKIKLQGNNITLFARRIIFGNSAEIDTSGTLGSPSYTGLAANSGASLGDGGAGGLDGGGGGSGGKIVVVASELIGSAVLTASGGNGGDAQSGGNGAAGKPGPDADGGKDGGTGGTGGAGGVPGHPGVGGNGGEIVLRAANRSDFSTFKIVSEGGRPGLKGNPGAGGQGGPGGHPARGARSHKYRCEN